jgi:hypothetical protein
VSKIECELKTLTGGQKEKAVAPFVATILQKFCKDNEMFAEVVYRTGRTLSDTCREVMDGTGNQISDFEVYRGAVKAYFPKADIHCYMQIINTVSLPTDEEINREPKVKAAAVNTRQAKAPSVSSNQTETKTEKIQVSLF